MADNHHHYDDYTAKVGEDDVLHEVQEGVYRVEADVEQKVGRLLHERGLFFLLLLLQVLLLEGPLSILV